MFFCQVHNVSRHSERKKKKSFCIKHFIMLPFVVFDFQLYHIFPLSVFVTLNHIKRGKDTLSANKTFIFFIKLM